MRWIKGLLCAAALLAAGGATAPAARATLTRMSPARLYSSRTPNPAALSSPSARVLSCRALSSASGNSTASQSASTRTCAQPRP